MICRLSLHDDLPLECFVGIGDNLKVRESSPPCIKSNKLKVAGEFSSLSYLPSHMLCINDMNEMQE